MFVAIPTATFALLWHERHGRALGVEHGSSAEVVTLGGDVFDYALSATTVRMIILDLVGHDLNSGPHE